MGFERLTASIWVEQRLETYFASNAVGEIDDVLDEMVEVLSADDARVVLVSDYPCVEIVGVTRLASGAVIERTDVRVSLRPEWVELAGGVGVLLSSDDEGVEDDEDEDEEWMERDEELYD
jgi:hypothetical protein